MEEREEEKCRTEEKRVREGEGMRRKRPNGVNFLTLSPRVCFIFWFTPDGFNSKGGWGYLDMWGYSDRFYLVACE